MTGTAAMMDVGSHDRKYFSSLVGVAQVSDPRLIIAIMIDEPSGGKHYGGDVAGPVFAGVMGGALRTLGIAPDAPLRAEGGTPGVQVAQRSDATKASPVREKL